MVPLKWYEKILMQYHYLICKLCQHYTFENNIINSVFLHHKNDLLFTDEEIEQYKNELLQKLNI